ncbi:MAG: DUF4367 domain-containing protein [Candidatus Nomurabacteria bacterium]|jgi:hypothetical protein|nr:DUF4367 domain-containing protein [Candidatus Nomurabacteria bacterium]
MGTVVINGKKYDARTGLPADIAMAIASEQPKVQAPIQVARQTQRVQTTQRQAQQIQQARQIQKAELGSARKISIQSGRAIKIKEEAVQTKKQTAPKWISNYVSASHDKTTPRWISNYLSGNDPVEIEPIAQEVATQSQKSSQKLEFTRSKPQNLHRAPDRAKTLKRSFVRKPLNESDRVQVTRRVATVEKHPKVYRFSPATSHVAQVATARQTVAPKVNKTEQTVTQERQIQVKTTTQPAHKTQAPIVAFKPTLSGKKPVNSAKARQATSGSQLKAVLIKEQLDKPIDRKSRRKAEKQAAKQFKTKRFFRAPTMIAATLAVVVLGGYFTYISLPSISIRVAANKAGIDAHVPYTPSGYSIDGPVASASGQIKINYKSNGGAAGYSITQQESDWSNSDIKDNLIPLKEDYKTMSANGVTVYRYGKDAAWVKNEILYTISGNEMMGDDQITKIAESV